MRYVIVDIATDGRTPVNYSYPRGAIDDFIRFVTRPNRFAVEQGGAEALADRVMSLRKRLINARESIEAPHGAWAAEMAANSHADVAANEFEGMGEVELYALADRISARLEVLTAPKFVESAPSVADELLEAAKT